MASLSSRAQLPPATSIASALKQWQGEKANEPAGGTEALPPAIAPVSDGSDSRAEVTLSKSEWRPTAFLGFYFK